MLKKHWLGVCVAVAGGLYIVWTARYSVMSDEIEHLHAAYLVSQGLLPFRDFWEHHSPFLWVVLSPLLRMLPESGGILALARAGCLLFSGALLYLVWSISKLLWREEAHFGTTALCFFSGALLAQYSFIRPDPFMLFFVFSSLYLLIRALQEGGGRFFICSGLCMALAFSFSPKWITALAVIPAALFLRGTSWRAWLRENLLFGTGFALGMAPLLAYLFGNGLWREFYSWVFKFNVKEIVFMGYPHPTILAALAAGMIGAAAAWKRFGPVRGLWLLLWGVVLFNAFFLYKLDIKHSYYAASFLLFACTLASGFHVLAKGLKNGWVRTALWSLLVAALILPNAQRVTAHERQFASFARQTRFIGWLAREFRGEVVMMVYPWHPIYARDAGILQMSNFFQGVEHSRRGFREHLQARGKWTEEVIDNRPSVIAKWEAERILAMLIKYRMIGRGDYQRFIRFLKSDYAPVTKDGATLLLRKGHPAARTADKVGQFTS